MLTVSKVSSGAEAGKYYPEGQEQNRDYYTSSQAPSEWYGRGAEALGLEGAVTHEQLRDALNGREEIFGRQLGTMKEGEHQRLGGVDFTFNAPKSVSMMAADGLGHDKRVVDAHDRAVTAALRHIEQRVGTRIREEGGIRREATDNIAVARFREDFTRPVRDPDNAGGKPVPDPHLHTHCVAINATMSADGQWRSLDTAQFFNEAFIKEATLVYRQELARELRDCGYELNVQRDGSFEIHGVSREAIEAFSRRSEQIEEKLAEKGKDRATATAEEKLAANKGTREAKVYADRESRVQDWQDRSMRTGLDARGLAEQAQVRAESWDYQAQLRTDAYFAARDAAKFAADKLAEREAAFSDRALRQEAAQYAVGKANAAELERAIREATGRDGFLHERTVRAVNPTTREVEHVQGWTTTKALATERDMLSAERLGRDRLQPTTSKAEARLVVDRAAATSRAGGHQWTTSQRRAAEGLLTSAHRVNGIQGYAGTAKTTTVLATYAKEMQARGMEVKAMAPTASAADTLGKALGVEARTVQRHLVEGQRAEHQQHAAGAVQANPGPERQVWVVDEASLLSAKQMGELLRQANEQNARVVLVGDVKQLGSVEAGRAFGQLQEAGMTTHKLDEIVRQTNTDTREGIYAAIRGDAKAALDRIEQGGGQVKEIRAGEDRRAEMAKDYLSLSSEARARTIVIDPSRQGRADLNEKIREGMKAEGSLQGVEIRATVLEAKGLTQAEAKDARSYSTGDVVRFGRAYEGQGIAKGEYLQVVASNSRSNTVTLQDSAGRTIEWNPRQWGASRSEAFSSVERGIQAGDRLTWTRNDDAASRKNGQGATVERVDRERGTATVRLEHGVRQDLDLRARASQHWDHAYAQTAHAAQGRTSDRVMVHAESHRQNLTNQKSFYVSLSRARDEVRVYTDNRERLIDAIRERAGEKQAAQDRSPPGARAGQLGQGRTLKISTTHRDAGADRHRPARGDGGDRRHAHAQPTGPAREKGTSAPRRPIPTTGRPAGGRPTQAAPNRKDGKMSDQHRGGARPQQPNPGKAGPQQSQEHAAPARQDHAAQHDPGRKDAGLERRGALGERARDQGRGSASQHRTEGRNQAREAPKPARVIAERGHQAPRQQQRQSRTDSGATFRNHMAREAKVIERALSHPAGGQHGPTVGQAIEARLDRAMHELMHKAERAVMTAGDRMFEKAAQTASSALRQGASRVMDGAQRQLNNAVGKALGEHSQHQARGGGAAARKGALGEGQDREATRSSKSDLERAASDGKGASTSKDIGRTR